jgi:hypothetical protein
MPTGASFDIRRCDLDTRGCCPILARASVATCRCEPDSRPCGLILARASVATCRCDSDTRQCGSISPVQVRRSSVRARHSSVPHRYTSGDSHRHANVIARAPTGVRGFAPTRKRDRTRAPTGVRRLAPTRDSVIARPHRPRQGIRTDTQTCSHACTDRRQETRTDTRQRDRTTAPTASGDSHRHATA